MNTMKRLSLVAGLVFTLAGGVSHARGSSDAELIPPSVCVVEGYNYAYRISGWVGGAPVDATGILSLNTEHASATETRSVAGILQQLSYGGTWTLGGSCVASTNLTAQNGTTLNLMIYFAAGGREAKIIDTNSVFGTTNLSGDMVRQ